MQFWCDFWAVRPSFLDFSFVKIWLGPRLKVGHVHRMTFCFEHLLGMVFAIMMVVWTKGKLLSIHINRVFHALLIEQFLWFSCVILIESARRIFLLWLREDQTVLVVVLLLSSWLQAEHPAENILVVKLCWRRCTYCLFCCFMSKFVLFLHRFLRSGIVILHSCGYRVK